MKHEPLCATNISCAVLHENGICPDKKECNCKLKTTPPTTPWGKRFDERFNVIKLEDGEELIPFPEQYSPQDHKAFIASEREEARKEDIALVKRYFQGLTDEQAKNIESGLLKDLEAALTQPNK